MAADRSLLVDLLPPASQHAANAWAGRQSGVGAVLGFWISNVDLPSTPVLNWFGDSQLKILSVIACFFLLATHVVTCVAVEERVLLEDDTDFDEVSRHGLRGALHQIFRVWRGLPRPIRAICNVQFFSWIGWFPVLFFSTTWIAEIWFRTSGSAGSGFGRAGEGEAATRAGSYAMLWHAIFSFVAAVALPALVPSDFENGGPATARDRRWNPPRASDSSLVDALLHASYRVRRILPNAPFAWLSIGSLWMWSHVFFAFLMFCTLFARDSLFLGSLIIGATGFSFAVSMWAPFALLGETILLDGAPAKATPLIRQGGWRQLSPSNTMESLPMVTRPPAEPPSARKPGELVGLPKTSIEVDSTVTSVSQGYATPPNGSATPPMTGEVLELRHSDSSDDGGEAAPKSMEVLQQQTPLGGSQERGRTGRVSEERAELDAEMDALEGSVDEGTADSAGVILGIHNIYIVLPQFLVTFLSSIVFAILAPGKSVIPEGEIASPQEGDIIARRGLFPRAPADGSWDAIGLIFRFGGVASLVAAWTCRRMLREQDRALARTRGG